MPTCAGSLSSVRSRLLLDTNVLIDFMVPDRAEHEAAEHLIARLADGNGCGFVSAGTLKDCYYVCRTFLGEEPSRAIIRQFLVIFEVLALGPQECREAAYSDEPDFEDGLLRALAEGHDMDFIITRDTEAFGRSAVRCLTAGRYLELFA